MRKNHIYRAYAYLRLSVEDGDQIDSVIVADNRKSKSSVKQSMMGILVQTSIAPVSRKS